MGGLTSRRIWGTASAVAMLLILVALVAFVIPTLAYASTPAQASPAPVDLAQSVNAFLDLLIAFAIGGGVAYALQMSQKWQDWRSPFKPLVVVALTAVLGAALSALKVILTAELFAQAPDYVNAFVSFIVIFVGSQVTYQKGFGKIQ